MSNPVARMLGHLYGLSSTGLDVTWTPSGGDPVTVRAIERREDRIDAFADTRLLSPAVVLQFRTADVAPDGLQTAGAIADGDALTVAGEARVVAGDPRHPDAQRLLVVVETRAA